MNLNNDAIDHKKDSNVNEKQIKKTNEVRCERYGGVLEDNSIIECVYHSERRPYLAFIVASPNSELKEATSFVMHGDTVYPPERDMKAIELGSVLLPSGADEYGSSLDLFQGIRSFLFAYLDFDDFTLDLLADYALMTWVWDAWTAIPYLRFQGQPSTGKTRCLEVLRQICYRSVDLGVSPSKSALFRSTDSVRGTLTVDEADYEGDLRSDLMKLLNAGYKRNGVTALSTPRGDDWHPQTFSVGGPKVLANRHSFNDPALETRCITIYTVAKIVASRISSEYPKAFIADGERLRRQLLMWRFRNLHQLDTDESALECLDGRARQICLPLYSVSPDPQFRLDLIAHMQKRGQELRKDDPVRVILEAFKIALGKRKPSTILLAEIRTVALQLGTDRDISQHTFTPKKVAELLRGLGFQTSKWGRGTTVLVDLVNLEAQCERFSVGEEGDGSDSAESKTRQIGT